MTKTSKFEKSPFKSKKKISYSNLDEENLSFKEIRRDKEHKQYRNYDNALRAKDISRLLSYEDD